MSDGITDSYRDQRRAEYQTEYLETILDFLRGNVGEDKVVSSAKNCDAVPRGLFGSETKLSKSVTEILTELKSNNPKTWGNLLLAACYDDRDKTYRGLLSLSPWPTKEMAHLDYGRNNDSLIGMMKSAMRKAGNAERFYGNPRGHFEYVVFYDETSTLEKIAESAVCVNIKVVSYHLGRDRIMPTSHKLEYLKKRDEYFDMVNR